MPNIKTKAEIDSMIDTVNALITSDGKIDAAEFKLLIRTLLDANGVSTPYTMGSNVYNADNGDLQLRNISANETLAVTNSITGKYYALIKTGTGILTLPTGAKSASGASVPSGDYCVTFLNVGGVLYFNFAPYTTV